MCLGKFIILFNCDCLLLLLLLSWVAICFTRKYVCVCVTRAFSARLLCGVERLSEGSMQMILLCLQSCYALFSAVSHIFTNVTCMSLSLSLSLFKPNVLTMSAAVGQVKSADKITILSYWPTLQNKSWEIYCPISLWHLSSKVLVTDCDKAMPELMISMIKETAHGHWTHVFTYIHTDIFKALSFSLYIYVHTLEAYLSEVCMYK